MMLAVCMVCKGQTYSFRHYEVESGLSNNAVMCSAQDKLGFMWFGTRDGLNRFDGYHFKTYRLPETQIHSICVDSQGVLLVNTEKSIYKYNPEFDNFQLYLSYGYSIEELVVDGLGYIWFNANNELCRFSPKTKRLTLFPVNRFFQVSALSVDQEGNLWAATPSGELKVYNNSTGQFRSYDLYSHSKNKNTSSTSVIKCIKNSKILIGADHGGLKIFDTDSGTYKDIELYCENLKDLFFRCFLELSDSQLWIGTERGVINVNTQSGICYKIEKNSSDGYTLSDNVIYTLTMDKEGGIWVGTYFGGINYYPMQYTPFEKYYKNSSTTPLSGNIVREITEDRLGNLWIGTEDGGLNKLDSKRRKITYYIPGNTKQSISYICVHSLLALKNEIWVGTYFHGIDILDIHSGKVIKHYEDSAKDGFNSNFPFSFLKTNGKIIVAALNGLYQFDQKTKKFTNYPHFPQNALYQCVFKDSLGILWASAYGKGVMYLEPGGKFGAFKFDPLDKNSLSSDMVTDIFEDSRGNLWFATENGLCKYDRLRRAFKRFGTLQGFSSNFMLSILEDSNRRLWISTTKGLTCFDPVKNKTITYTTANGLLSDQFNFSSAYKDKQNRLYFGSAKGLIIFSPEKFRKDTFVPEVFITGIQINSKEININAQTSPLKQSILFTREIVLDHNQSTVALDFAGLGFTAPQDLLYAYKLEGLTNGWTFTKKDRKANFTKLLPGIYIFKVKAASTSRIWSKNVTTLKITILPPWWSTNSAYFFYAILLLLIIYFTLKYYHNRTQEKNKRTIERLEIAQEKEILQMEIAKEKEMLENKVEFFTQVAHEIRTPLTLIKIPLGKVIRKTEGMDEIKNSLKIIGGNTDRLIELSNQLLDFRQTEIKAYGLSFEWANISELLENTYQNFSDLAEQNHLKLIIELPNENLFAFVDIDAFTKIIYNLLGNAVKYASSKVIITLRSSMPHSDYFIVVFKNDGPVIAEHLKEKIFEPFFRIKESDAKTGSGIGLALARSITMAHNGTLEYKNENNVMNIFTLTLHINNTNE